MNKSSITMYSSIDITKFICSLLVIIIHTRPFTGTLGYLLTNGVARIAVPFFFLASGYFFYEGYKNNKEYYKKYLKNIFKIYTIWYLIYMTWRVLVEKQGFKFKEGIILIREYFFSGYYQLWYMPSLIISILFVYMFLKRNKYLALGVISCVLYFIGIFGDAYGGLINNQLYNNIVAVYRLVFGMTKTGICFGVPMITLGVLINKYNLKEKVKVTGFVVAIGIGILLLETYFLEMSNIGFGRNMLMSFIILIPCLFIWLLNLKCYIIGRMSKMLRDLSLTIYCSHALFIMVLDKIFAMLEINIAEGDKILQFFIVTAASVLLGIIMQKMKERKLCNRKLDIIKSQ